MLINTEPPAQQSKQPLQSLTLGADCPLSALSEPTAVACPDSLYHGELQWADELAHPGGVNSEASL